MNIANAKPFMVDTLHLLFGHVGKLGYMEFECFLRFAPELGTRPITFTEEAKSMGTVKMWMQGLETE